MAAPQIAGMAALVMEHLKTKYPALAADDAQRRHIAQSLLMSTAEPMMDPDGHYYPVLQQGAGLANAEKAVTADAYITMDKNAVFRPRSADDGKVKAELGANESGEFEFSFTVHNLDTVDAHMYKLSTDLFTQAPTFLTGGETRALSTKTTTLYGDVQYAVNGKDIDPYDLFTVEAGGSVTVTVHITIDDPAISDENYPAGAYVEGYTWLFPNGDMTSGKDVHSIPLLGFYGDWSAPSMFERATSYDYLVKRAAERTSSPGIYTEAAKAAKLPYTGSYTSELLIAHSATTGRDFSLRGNPWFLEPVRPLQQMAVNSGDTLQALQAVFLRNGIADMEIVRINDEGADLGKPPLWSPDSRYVTAAYARGFWYSDPEQLPTIGVGPQDLSLAAGERFVLRVAAMPEYFWRDELIKWGTKDAKPLEEWDMRTVKGDTRTVWEQLGRGAKREYPLWVDSGVGPAVLAVTRSGNSFTVTAQDDLYTAWVSALDTEFEPFWDEDDCDCVPNLDPDPEKRPAKRGESYDAVLTFESEVPERFIIIVGDYAGNARYYQIDAGGGTPVPVTPPTPAPAPTPSPIVPTPKPASADAGPTQPAVAPISPAAAPTAAPIPTPGPTAVQAAPRTADDLPLTALYIVFGAAAAGLIVLYIVWWRRRK